MHIQTAPHSILVLTAVVLAHCCTIGGIRAAGAMEPVAASATAIDKKTAHLPDGIDMTYLELGRRDGQAVVLIHGYTDSALSFLATAKALEQRHRGLRIFVIDQRGHGDTSMPAGESCAASPESCFTLRRMAEDVVAFMDDRNVAKAHVVGHSLGSMVAQELALQWPDRISSLVLIGTTADATSNPIVSEFLAPEVEVRWKAEFSAQGRRWPQDAYLLGPGESIPGAATWIAGQWAVEAAADPALLRDTARIAGDTPIGTWLGVLRNISTFSSRERLQQLTVPALVLWAENDEAFPEGDQAVLRKALDAAVAACTTRYAFKTYRELGHNTQWGAPETVAADIASWIRDGAAARPDDPLLADESCV